MTTQERVPLTIELDDALRCRLEDVARRKGISLSKYGEQVMEQAVAEDEPKALTYEEELAWLENLERLRKDIFGDRILPDSVPMIRKMRGHRTSRYPETGQSSRGAAQ